MNDKNVSIKTAEEIGIMCSQLNEQYQTLVLNAINTLLGKEGLNIKDNL